MTSSGSDRSDARALDEHRMLAARRTRPTVFVTGFVDLRTGQLLDLAVGRSASVVERWLAGRPGWWLDNVHAVALDPHQGYANGADRRPAADRAGRGPLPRHQVGQRVDDVRRRVQQATTGHRGRKDEPLYRTRRLATRPGSSSPTANEIGCSRPSPPATATARLAPPSWARSFLREVYASTTTELLAGLSPPSTGTAPTPTFRSCAGRRGRSRPGGTKGGPAKTMERRVRMAAWMKRAAASEHLGRPRTGGCCPGRDRRSRWRSAGQRARCGLSGLSCA